MVRAGVVHSGRCTNEQVMSQEEWCFKEWRKKGKELRKGNMKYTRAQRDE